MSAGLSQEFSPFRLVVLILLIVIATLQFLILLRISTPGITPQTLEEAKNPADQEALEESIPLVRVYNTVDVQGTVDVGTVSDEVSVDVRNEPLQVTYDE